LHITTNTKTCDNNLFVTSFDKFSQRMSFNFVGNTYESSGCQQILGRQFFYTQPILVQFLNSFEQVVTFDTWSYLVATGINAG